MLARVGGSQHEQRNQTTYALDSGVIYLAAIAIFKTNTTKAEAILVLSLTHSEEAMTSPHVSTGPSVSVSSRSFEVTAGGTTGGCRAHGTREGVIGFLVPWEEFTHLRDSVIR